MKEPANKTNTETHNLLKGADPKVLKQFKDYVKSRGWSLGKETSKSLEMYLTIRVRLDVVEKKETKDFISPAD